MHSLVWGATAVLVLWGGPAIASWTFDPIRLFRGADGRPSASQFQFLVCTAVLIASYVSVRAALAAEGRWQAEVEVPRSLLTMLGMSALTVVGAKIVTGAQVLKGRLSKRRSRASSLVFLFAEDDGRLDLARLAIVAWTMIVAAIQLARLAWLLRDVPPSGPLSLPPVDDGMVGLLAVGHAAYLGGKVVSFDQPRLTGLAPSSGRAPLPLTITGSGLGCGEGASLIVDGMPVAVFIGSWTNDRIELTLPATRPDGAPWPRDRAVGIGLITDGRSTLNVLPFAFA